MHRKSGFLLSLLLLWFFVLPFTSCSNSQSTGSTTFTAGWEYQLDQPSDDDPHKGYAETLFGKAPDSDTFVEVYQSDIGSAYMEYAVSSEKVYVCYDTYLYVMDPDGTNCNRIYKKCGGTLAIYDGYLYTTKSVKNSIGGAYPYLIRISLDSYDVEETDIPVRTFSLVDGGSLEITTDKNRTSFESGMYKIEDLPWK